MGSCFEQHAAIGRLSATLPLRPDAERIRLRLGTTFIEHADDLWPEGGAPSSEWMRDHVDELLEALEHPLRHDGRDVRRLPRRLWWFLWLVGELNAM